MSDQDKTKNLVAEMITGLEQVIDVIRQYEATQKPIEPAIAQSMVHTLKLCEEGVYRQQHDAVKTSITNLQLLGRIDFLERVNLDRGGHLQ